MTALLTNADRSEHAFRATLAYKTYSGAEEDTESNIIDLMADLLHLAADYGDPEQMQRTAWHHYMAETAEEDVMDMQLADAKNRPNVNR